MGYELVLPPHKLMVLGLQLVLRSQYHSLCGLDYRSLAANLSEVTVDVLQLTDVGVELGR